MSCKCKIVGHKWKVIRSLSDARIFELLNMGIAYEYSLSFSDKICTRCNKTDFGIEKEMANIGKYGFTTVTYEEKFGEENKEYYRESKLKKLLD